MKIDKEVVEEVIRNMVTDNAIATSIIAQIEQRAQEQREQRITPQGHAETLDVIVLLTSAEDVPALRSLAERSTALAFKIEEGQNHQEIIPSLIAGAAEYNSKKRKRNLCVSTLGEACGVLSPKKHLNNFPKKILVKNPSMILVSENLPINNETQPATDEDLVQGD